LAPPVFSDLAGGLTSDQAEEQKLAFASLSDQEQATFLLNSLEHWATLNQVVTIRHRWGLRNKGNTLPPWFKELLIQLQTKPQVRLILISERQLPRTEVEALGNVQQFHLEELDAATIQFILTLRVVPRFLDPLRLPQIAEKINGHPATANFTAYLINSGRSMESLALAPDAVLAFQDKVLQELYEKNVLSELQKRILKLLSWFPKLSISIICEAFSDHSKETVVEELWELSDFSLIDQSEGGKYKVPAVVSSTYRRKQNNVDADIFENIAAVLRKQFDEDRLDYDLIESLLLAIVSSGETISPRLLQILTPGRIEPVVESLYYEGISAGGEDAKLSFNRCHALSKLAMSMKGSDDSIENILFFGADAKVRLVSRPDDMIDFMRRRAFVTAEYIDASYLFHSNRDFETASKILSKSLQAAGFKIRNVRLLTRIYLRTGQFQLALDTLSKIPDVRLLRDTGLVMMKVKALRGMRNRSDVAKLLYGIQDKPDEYGEYSTYQASVALREGRFEDAIKHVEAAKRAPRSNKAILSVLECACELEKGNLSSLTSTCALARAMNREADAFQLQARAALVSKDWRSSEEYIQKVNRKDWFDLNVEYRATELKLQDPEILRDPVVKKAALAKQEDLLRQLAGAVEGSSFA
jgi:tetratricopeptide (TPR) repeat protein